MAHRPEYELKQFRRLVRAKEATHLPTDDKAVPSAIIDWDERLLFLLARCGAPYEIL